MGHEVKARWRGKKVEEENQKSKSHQLETEGVKGGEIERGRKIWYYYLCKLIERICESLSVGVVLGKRLALEV